MFYRIEKISEDTYRFNENGRANCYLIVGKEKALLIDGCWGIGDLKQTIREITDKPVIAVATHRHPDHTCGLRQLSEYYVSEKDNTKYNRRLENRLFGIAMALAEKQKIRSYHNQKPGLALRLNDGDIFNLGDRAIEAKAIPGHTAGSMMFLDHSKKLMFAGDDVNPKLWMQGNGATSLSEWKIGANLVLDYMKQGYTAWIGHLNGRQIPEQLVVIMDMVDEIIAKKKNGQLTKKDSPYRRQDALPEIRFNIENIY
ncbi:MAG: MBL fold metallo-hydrolase [Clostridia bacterium]|nr:MBL fold metallo-hydrolase [Clostridia bacterium]